jgi:hypothetical protein
VKACAVGGRDAGPKGAINDRWITFWRLILISLHLKCDLFKFAPAFNLNDYRITS